MNALTQDLSTLTTIPKVQLDNLFSKIIYVLCHEVHEAIQNEESVTQLDIGVGTIYLSLVENEVKYKFIPSVTFDSAIKNTIISGESPLTNMVEERLRDRIINTYKDII